MSNTFCCYKTNIHIKKKNIGKMTPIEISSMHNIPCSCLFNCLIFNLYCHAKRSTVENECVSVQAFSLGYDNFVFVNKIIQLTVTEHFPF